MGDYVSSALFVYTDDGRQFVAPLQSNGVGATISAITFDALMRNVEEALTDVVHVVVSGGPPVIRTVLELAAEYGFGVGIIPLRSQKELVRTYALPVEPEQAIDLSLRQARCRVKLVRCGGTVVLTKATIGRLPLLDAAPDTGRLEMVVQAVRKFFGLRLLPFSFVTAGDRKVSTAACGCVVAPYPIGNRAVRKVLRYTTVGDSMATVIISAPSSIVRYLQFLVQILALFARQARYLPSTLGYIKSSAIEIDSDDGLLVTIDSDATTSLPARVEVLSPLVGLNVGQRFVDENRHTGQAGEKLSIRELPQGKEELAKAGKKSIPFFPYASEERFRDLFVALRDDARINSTYVALMILSTALATIGLYQDSPAVVIGAMLLAPLMAPIISLAMGLVRQDNNLTRGSINKILAGIVIALLAAALITLVFPHKPITGEMQSRLNPSLLDLGVAIVAGIAGAYTKAYKEILQSLAGVAIAVALVPPLAVAGIGLGRADPYFFAQAFLLFATNLIGIILAGGLTFRFLGYAPAIRGKRSVWIVVLALAAITVPLYLSYMRIVEANLLEKSWQHERFLVNGKYLIVKKASLNRYRDRNVMTMDILAREIVSREDLSLFKQKIQENFDRQLVVNARIVYIP